MLLSRPRNLDVKEGVVESRSEWTDELIRAEER